MTASPAPALCPYLTRPCRMRATIEGRARFRPGVTLPEELLEESIAWTSGPADLWSFRVRFSAEAAEDYGPDALADLVDIAFGDHEGFRIDRVEWTAPETIEHGETTSKAQATMIFHRGEPCVITSHKEMADVAAADLARTFGDRIAISGWTPVGDSGCEVRALVTRWSGGRS